MTTHKIGKFQNPTMDLQIKKVVDSNNQHASDTSNPHSVTADQVLPSQTGNSGKYLTTNGTTASWATVSSGYTLNVLASSFAPTDGSTVYFGNLAVAPTTTAAIRKVYIRKAGTIKIAEIYCYANTAGTAENWSLYVRVNNTSDTLIATVGSATNERVFSNTSLSISVSVGDYIEIKSVHPTWATNPNSVYFGGYLYIE